MSWLLYTVLWWTLGCTCLFQIWFPRCVCPEVGLLGHMPSLFLWSNPSTKWSDLFLWAVERTWLMEDHSSKILIYSETINIQWCEIVKECLLCRIFKAPCKVLTSLDQRVEGRSLPVFISFVFPISRGPFFFPKWRNISKMAHSLWREMVHLQGIFRDE